MSFSGLILTNQGKNEMAAAISNEKELRFTHIQLGDGVYNGSYLSKKSLENEVMQIPVTRVSRREMKLQSSVTGILHRHQTDFIFGKLELLEMVFCATMITQELATQNILIQSPR